MSERASPSRPGPKRPSRSEKEQEQARRRRDLEIADVKAVLDTEAGKRLMWRLLEEASVFESIWDPSSKIHYKAGKQDFGHFLLAEIGRASPEAYVQMMHQAQKRAMEEQIRKEQEEKEDKETSE